MNKIFSNKPLGITASIIMFLLSVALIFGLSYAIGNTLPFESETTSNITTGNFNVALNEVYQEPSGVLPGQSVEKIVNVKNSGSVDALVRVKVKKECSKSNGEALNNANEIININYDETDWLYINGYYYYKNILKANSETKTPLFKNYTISKSAGNEYKNAKCDIVVNADTIQASKDALNSLWSIENPDSFLKTSYGLDQDVYEPDAKVTYTKDKKITFDGKESSDVDLFKNFKNLTPGTTRRQLITVQNDYQNAQAFYLKAKETSQGDSLDEQTKQKVNNLIKNYATINIQNKAGNSIYNGPIWGNLDKENPTMKDYILLGSIDSNKFEDYTVSLSVSSDMPNDYQNLIGYITWEFGTLNTDAIINVHHYIEGTTIPINIDGQDVPTKVISGEIGKTYTANALDTAGKYTLVSPKSQTATFKADDTDVIFYYRLTDPVFESEPTVKKTSNPETIETKDSSVTYNIKYEAKITEFKGIITVDLEDILPEGKLLDESYSNNFDGGTYNSETNKITWSSYKFNIDTYDNNPNNDSINITKQITVKYKTIENNEELVNTINSKTKYKLTEDGPDLGERI